jgi:hypothetical protein
MDKGEKKRIYPDELRVPEYFWYDPFSGELAGFGLREGRYGAIEPDRTGRLKSAVLGLWLQRWEGRYEEVQAVWLRWATEAGELLPTGAEHEKARAEHEKARAEQAELRARQAEEALAAEAGARRPLEAELAALRAGREPPAGSGSNG